MPKNLSYKKIMISVVPMGRCRVRKGEEGIYKRGQNYLHNYRFNRSGQRSPQPTLLWDGS